MPITESGRTKHRPPSAHLHFSPDGDAAAPTLQETAATLNKEAGKEMTNELVLD